MDKRDDIEDPTGRLKAGMTFRFKNSTVPQGRIIGFCAPSGLHRRPMTPEDLSGANGEVCQWIAEDVKAGLLAGMPCAPDHPAAVYQPRMLMATIRYQNLRERETTLHAEDIEEHTPA